MDSIWILKQFFYFLLIFWIIHWLLIRKLLKTIIFFRKFQKLNGPDTPFYRIIGTVGGFKPRWDLQRLANHTLNIFPMMAKFFPEDVIGFWFSVCPTVLIHRADHAKILSGTININKPFPYDLFRPWLNDCIFVCHPEKWHQRRKLLTPAFHFNILKQFIPIMNEQAKILVDIIREESSRSQYVDIVPIITDAALSIITETAMGLKMDLQRNPQPEYHQYAEAMGRLSHDIFKRIIFPWLQNDFIYFNLFSEGRRHREDLDLVLGLTVDLIRKRKSDFLNNKSLHHCGEKTRGRLAFMDLLIEHHLTNPEQFTEADIKEEVDAFMFAGHDTVANSLTWTLYLLGNHPEIQDRIHEEIDSIEDESTDEEFIGWKSDQLTEMKFLEACIKEALRLYPVAPVVSRVAGEDILLDDGHIIPKGIVILLLLTQIHRDPKYFDRPEFFHPDRFLSAEENGNKPINPFAFIPFSAGPRNCIGQKFAIQEEKILLATILRQYKIRSRLPINSIRAQPEIVLRPIDPVDIQFIPRNKQPLTPV